MKLLKLAVIIKCYHLTVPTKHLPTLQNFFLLVINKRERLVKLGNCLFGLNVRHPDTLKVHSHRPKVNIFFDV